MAAVGCRLSKIAIAMENGSVELATGTLDAHFNKGIKV
jgi:hypothetical protein